jgi:predicted permease
MDVLRDQRGLPLVDDLARDVRYATRTLARTPLFSAIVIVTLAIGVGANTAVFGVVNSVLLRPLPYPQSSELVAIWHTAPGAAGMSNLTGDLRLSPSMYYTYAEQNRTFQHLGVWFAGKSTVTGVGEPEQVSSLIVSDGVLEALAVQPHLGRWLLASDHEVKAPRTVIIGHGYWLRRFGADRSVIGRQLTVDSRPREIIGVMPEGFGVVNATPDVIVPFGFDRAQQRLPGFGLQGIGRLKPGVTLEQASADIARLVPIWMRSWPAAPSVDPRIYENWRITPALRPLAQDVVGGVSRALWVLMGTIGIVMVIASANVAGLLLVRTEGRQQELAVRAALGAGRARITRGLLVESVVLGLAGGALGLVVAAIGLDVLVSRGPESLPRLDEIGLDWRAIAFALFISIFAALVFGLLPALKYSGAGIALSLRSAGRTATAGRERHRARNALVVAQVALALVLLVSSGLMIRTFQALRNVDPGFIRPDTLQTFELSIPPSLVPEPARVVRLQNDIVDAITAIPGVTSAGIVSVMPMVPQTPEWDAINVEGRVSPAGEIPPLRFFKSISPGFFATSGTRIVAGRDLTWTDVHEHRPVVMVSENLARELWDTPHAAVGKRVRTLDTSPWREVVGVVQDVRDHGAHEPPPSTVYWPLLVDSASRPDQLNVERAVTFAVRSPQAGSQALLGEIRSAVWSKNASLSFAAERTMEDIYDASMARTSFTLVMLAIAGLMALVLGVVGIYGVLSYAVSQRTREIGIRLALGAQRAELKRMFMRHALILTGTGTLIGLGVAAGLTRVMASLLFGISPLDPVTYVAVPVVLITAALVASYVPARRAAAVDPVLALKTDYFS